MEKYLLCCDWGTSSFRLRLVSRSDRHLIGEISTQNGIGHIYNFWKEDRAGDIARPIFFKQHLKTQVGILSKNVNLDLDHVPILLSGMASSSIGMEEIPYAELPFSLDGCNVFIKHHAADPQFPHDIALISGVRSQQDVMRGEETQLIGIAEMMRLPLDKDAIFIFPGTHSKHLYVKNGTLVDFKTYMTGEVFNIMGSHSILKDSVQLDSANELCDLQWAAFEEGICHAKDSDILNALFKVRTRQLFDFSDKKQNASYLSGLLIGAEMRNFKSKTDRQLVLCSGQNLHAFYQKAIEILDLSNCATIIPPQMVENAASTGQIKIFEHQLSLSNNKL